MILRSRFLLFVAALLVPLLLFACGQPKVVTDGEAPDAPSASTQTPVVRSTAATAAGEAAPTTTGRTNATGEEQAGTSLPAEFGAMLSALGDHWIEIRVKFEGQDESGSPVSFEWLGRETVTAQPSSYRLDLSAVDGESQSGFQSMTVMRQDDLGYLYVPEVGCVSSRAGDFADDMRLPLDPATLMEGLSDAAPVADGVVVNGFETAEFHFDERALAWSSEGPWSIDGALFVREGSDMITRLEMTLSGRGDLLAEERILNGTYEIVVDVVEIADDMLVEVPEACRQAFRYPITQDAFEITAIEDLLAFNSRSAMADVVNFYLAEMPSADWHLSAEPDVFEDLAVLYFEREGTALMITVEYDSETDTVSVLISP